MSEKINRRVELAMACSCGDGEKICAEYLDKVMDGVEDRRFPLSTIIYALENLRAFISGTAADMWMGITVEQHKGDEIVSVYCECDLAEYGLAKIILYLRGELDESEVKNGAITVAAPPPRQGG